MSALQTFLVRNMQNPLENCEYPKPNGTRPFLEWRISAIACSSWSRIA